MTTQRIGHYTSSSSFIARSPVLAAPADDTYQVIQVPRKAFINNVWLYVVTAFVGGPPTVTLGYTYNGSSDAAGFMSNDVARPLFTGVKRAIKDAIASYGDGIWCTAGNLIVTLTTDDNAATTVGTMYVMAEYYILN